MGREEENYRVAFCLWVGFEGGADVVGKGLDETGVGWPTVDYGPFNLLVWIEFAREHKELIQTGTGGRARVLWVLCECHSPGNAIVEELLKGGVGERSGIAECYVWFMWGGRRGDFVENLAGFGCLVF
jgi:hypothetical protein